MGGASNLTTAGSLTYVVSAGVIGQATSLAVSGAGTTAEALTVYNSIASGVTKLTVKAGAGQSTTNLQEWQNSSGTVVASVTSTGALKAAKGSIFGTPPSVPSSVVLSLGNTTGKKMLIYDGGTANNLFAGFGIDFPNANDFTWFGHNNANMLRFGKVGTDFTTFTSMLDLTSTLATLPTASVLAWSTDTSLSRIGAGIVGVGTGAAGSTAGTLQAAVLKVDGSAGTGITFTTDNVADIGASGASRPRNVYAGGGFILAGAGTYAWASRSQMASPSDGNLQLANAAGTDFNRLQFGGTTNSFPALKRSTTGLIARLADDSADTWVQASQFRSTLTTPASAAATGVAGTIVADANYIYVAVGVDTWKRVAIATW